MPDPKRLLDALAPAEASLLRDVVGAADGGSMAVYLVGGPVRDLLLGRTLRDVDLIVEGEALRGASMLGRAVAACELTVHERFGTASLARDGASVDLAAVRSESYAHSGALPTVEAGSLQQDLERRDFSVNALAMPLSRVARERHGGLVDPTGGMADLERRQLRILHPRSFHDDPTRALRAARLGPRLGFSVSRSSRSGLRDALRDGVFGRVSGDRLRREIVKLFEDSSLGLDPARALRWLADAHVLSALEPGLSLPPGAAASLRRLGRFVAEPVWQRSGWRVWVSGMELWMAGLSPSLRRRALRRFSVRGETARRIAGFAAGRDRWLRTLARARGRGAIDGVLRALDEDDLHALYFSADASTRRRIARHATEDRSRRLPIGGDDLVALGLAGPAVGRALARIRIAFLDGAVRDRAEALALARELSSGRGRPRKSASRARKS